MKKVVFKLLSDYRTLLIVWVFFSASPFLEVIRYKMPTWIMLDYSYMLLVIKGIVKVYMWLFMFLNTLIFAVWYKNIITPNYLKTKHYFALGSIAFLTIVYEVAIRIMLYIDYSHYPNYIFSIYGIKPEFLRLISIVNYVFLGIILGLFVAIYESKLNKKNIKAKDNESVNNVNKFNILTVINVLAIVILFSMSMYPFINLPILLKESKNDYKKRIGNDYVYIDALVKLTPESSNIIHPPQSNSWPLIGNQPIIRFFLFPRVLISGRLIDNNNIVSNFKTSFFVVIDKTDSANDWPVIEKVRREIMFDGKNYVKYSNIIEIGEFSGKKVYRIEF